jgi:hypothetical protein
MRKSIKNIRYKSFFLSIYFSFNSSTVPTLQKPYFYRCWRDMKPSTGATGCCPTGATVNGGAFLFGAALTLETEIYLTDRVVLLAGIRQRLLSGSSAGMFLNDEFLIFN